MRLVFIHGINNQDSTVGEIRDNWMSALLQGWKDLGLSPKKPYSAEAAYYADILAAASDGRNAAVEMGGGDVSSGLATEFLRVYSEAAGVTEEELRAAAVAEGLDPKVVEQGIPHEGWVIAFAKALERVLPTKGKYIAKLFLRQAAVYIGDPVLAAKIARTVTSQVFERKPDPTIVIGHSLGSVVAYRLLADDAFAGRSFPLFVTIGSPLGVDMFRPILPKKAALPKPPIARWINGRNKVDFVTLGKAITRKSIGFDGIDDITDVIDNEADRHDIVAYLSSPKIARAVFEAIENSN
ncbi:hypothetical protein HFO42_22895 [Rhizobium leguminosarum]|uniref:Alpha/beta hydrolase n=1 Tax=Rhizobium leguminosarum TaxID=384 RepID=A0AAJ1EKA0_RHILE|nr:GPI inositol-deacylase [Rhizobium leguminosarum]MBY5533811.1 hypothetical protein [Rhizobium leguminosarum]MBY5594899.1 hypothetical protein [Rhizobium leguminosarum]MBY5630924.1 hypothetical protein [Rhizobium leguminosarum]MBY5652657.1 hypothetical protein [Rhizobium leguminosarum]